MSVPGTSNQVSVVPPHPIIEEAFKKFEQIVRPNDNRLFRQTTLEDVRKSAQIISRDQSQRRCLRNLNRIKPLFDLLAKLSGPIDTLCQGTPYLSYLWAPIKLILQIADEYSASFEKIIDAYVQIAQNLPRLDRLSTTFSEQADFQSTLAEVYSDILEFHSQAYQFLRRGGWKTLFDASWRSFGSRFNNILRRLDRGRELLDKEAASFELLESRDFRQRMLEDLDRKERERKEFQMHDLLLWLDLKGQDREQEELVERRNASREPTTCTWFLHNAKVCSWLEDEDSNAFLWLNGKPGSGKTTLAAYMIEEATFPPNSMVIYCLCSYGFGKSETNACSLTIRSLIAQIIRSRSDLLPHVYDNYVKVGVAASLPKTRAVLKDLLSAIESTYMIVDGIDECEVIHQRQIISELFSLVSQSQEDHRIKMLICSRETPEITRKLNRVPRLSLNEAKENIERDITTFTMTHLKDLYDQFDQDIVESIGKEIVQKANGSVIQLVLATLLNQGSVQDLRSAINRLPADLYGVYQSILQRIVSISDAHQEERVKFIFGLIASSCRPLKVWEVCDLVVFHEGAELLDDQNKLIGSILNNCKPLIEELDGEHVQIVHFSAREFLFENVSGPYLRSINANTDITIACIRYLLTCEGFLVQPLDGKIFDNVVRGYHNLFPYVFEFWTVHMTKSSVGPATQTANWRHDDHPNSLINALAALAGSGDVSIQTGVLNSHGLPALQINPQKVSQGPSEFPKILKEYLSYRSKLMQKQHQVITGLNSPAESVLADPTTLKWMHKNFMSVFEGLLSEGYPQGVIQGVDRRQIEHFRSRHRGSAFLCRCLGCMWASTGFGTSEERDRHEELHRKQFRCPYPDCDGAIGGFTSKQALRRHEDKYHTKLSEVVLPPFPTQTDGIGRDAHREVSQSQNIQNEHPQMADETKQASDPMLHPDYVMLYRDQWLKLLESAFAFARGLETTIRTPLFTCSVNKCGRKGMYAFPSYDELYGHLKEAHDLVPLEYSQIGPNYEELQMLTRHIALQLLPFHGPPSPATITRSHLNTKADEEFAMRHYRHNLTAQDQQQGQQQKTARELEQSSSIAQTKSSYKVSRGVQAETDGQLMVGTQVFYRYSEPIVDGKWIGIHCSIEEVSSDVEGMVYYVRDQTSDFGVQDLVQKVRAKDLIPIPPKGTLLPIIPGGTVVYALLPGLAYFGKAVVQYHQRGIYIVNFELYGEYQKDIVDECFVFTYESIHEPDSMRRNETAS